MNTTTKDISCVALIPARAGSKRVPGKNLRILGGHPLIAYTIASALQSQLFKDVIVSTDCAETAAVAKHYGAQVPFLRPAELAGDLSADIEWIEYTLEKLQSEGKSYDAFAILRPTNPFRMPATLHRAWNLFSNQTGVDSLRAVEKCTEHPCKMWVIRGSDQPRLLPLIPFGPKETPWHSTPYQSLPEVFVQNASLEIAWTRTVLHGHTIAGETIVPFLTDKTEGFDINHPEDLKLAETMVAEGSATLPEISVPPYDGALPYRQAG